MLIDAQYADSQGYKDIGGLGMVAMFYFSNEGKNVEVRWYSTVQQCYYRTENQFSFTINTVKAAHTEATEKINALPSADKVTLNNVVEINSVANYYNNLSKESQAKVTNASKLNELLAKIESIYLAKENANTFKQRFLCLSTELNASTKIEIDNLWAIYNNLTEKDKAEIEPYYIYQLIQKEALLGENVMAAERAKTCVEILATATDLKQATQLARKTLSELTQEQKSFITNLNELEKTLADYEKLVA
jgi:hypothetical protein